MIETVVDSIRVSLVTQARVVILKEVEGDRHLPIWIGAFEAEAIAMELQGISSPRPLPYDLLRSVIGELGGDINRIVITEINNDVYYARIIIQQNGMGVEIDSRPSDAIALAVRAKVPIFVDDSVMARAGVQLDDNADDESTAEGEGTGEPTVSEEKLSAFRDFIDTLDLDDFGQKRDN
ncbi:MAG: bifunctional nuclease family protein [Thermomicrobiales bacterium]|nr:bifunctional nuclease family protein [Thermomicrobiales bacterium]